MNVKVKVVTKAGRNEVKKEDDYLKVYLTEAPEKGKANRQLIAILAKHFGASKSDIELIRGHKSKFKTVHFKIPLKI